MIVSTLASVDCFMPSTKFNGSSDIFIAQPITVSLYKMNEN